jgi:hypothetical protein
MPPDSRRLIRPLALSVATAVLVAGALYSLVRPVSYESRATLALSPAANVQNTSQLLSTFGASGTVGTYVELLESRDVRAAAGSASIDVDARAVAASRAIRVKAEGRPKSVVRPSLVAVVEAAGRRQSALKDPWELRVLQAPTPPKRVGASTPAMLAATVMMALLALLLVVTVGGQPPVTRARTRATHHHRPVPSGAQLLRRGWRYPTRL